MSTPSVAAFVQVLCQSRLLDHRQLDKLTRQLQYRFADPQLLGQDLVRRGWLTPQQLGTMLGGDVAAQPSSYAEKRAASQRRWRMFNVVGLIFIAAVFAVILYVIRQDKLKAHDKAEEARLAALDAHAQAELKPIQTAFDNSKRDDAAVRKQLLQWRMRFAEVPSAVQSAVMLAGLQSPLDSLDKANIRKEEQEKGQPDNLVAILGERRWRHWGSIRTLAVNLTGSLVATGGDDSQLRIWDRKNGKEITALPVGSIVALTFLPGDKLLAFHTKDGNVALMKTDTWTKHGDYPGPMTKVTTASFSKDGLIAASAGEGGVVKVWELQTGKELGELRGLREAVNAIAFAPDGETLATAGNDGAVILWGTSGNAKAQLAQHTDAVTSVVFSSDGKLLASGGGGRDNNIIIWDAAKGESLQTIEGHEGAIQSLVFTPDSKQIVSGSADATVRMTEVRPPRPMTPPPPPNTNGNEQKSEAQPNNQEQPNGNQQNNDNPPPKMDTPPPMPPTKSFKYIGHAGPVLAVSLFGEGQEQTIAAAGGDGVVRLWSVSRRGDMSGVRDHLGPIISMVFLDDQLLATGGQDKMVRVWDAQGTAARMLFAGHTAPVSSVSYSPMQKLVVSGSYDGSVRLWEVSNSKELAALTPNLGPVMCVAISPDGKSIVSGATSDRMQGGELKIWDPALRRERGTLPVHADVVSSVAFAPDGRTFASGSHDGTVKMFEPWTGQSRGFAWADKAAVESLAFAPDGKTLAVSTHQHLVRIIDVTNKEVKQTLSGLTALCRSLSFSPDGTLLAGTQPDGRVIVWETATGKSRDWKMPGPVNAVAFALDSRHLATGNANGTIYILRLAEAPKRGKK
jgi:WD40 repeat protein